MVTGFTTACMSVYTPDLQQGNVITQEMIDELKLGMSRRQVRFILGTPLIEDSFHRERWDYYYFQKRRKEPGVRRKLSVIFKDTVLAEIRQNEKASPKDGNNEKTVSQDTLFTQEEALPAIR